MKKLLFICLFVLTSNYIFGSSKDYSKICSYTGSIQKYQVKMYLHFVERSARGEYSYKSFGNDLNLKGSITGDSLIIREYTGEFADSAEENKHLSGIFHLVMLKDGNLVGIWRNKSGKKNFNVSLKQDFTAEYSERAITSVYLNHNPAYKCDTVYTSFQNEIHFLNTPDSKLTAILNQICRNPVLDYLTAHHNLDLSTLPKKYKQPFGEDALKEYYDGFADSSYTSAWWSDSSTTLTFADNHVISLSMNVNGFSGGAHDYLYGTNLNISTITGDTLDIRKAFVPGYKHYLDSIGEIYFRKDMEFPKNVSLHDEGYFWDDDPFWVISDTYTNYSFSAKGVEIFYNPYDIAPWVSGIPAFCIPYKALKPIIDPSGPLKWILSEY